MSTFFQAFGVGAFEDEDEDIYATEDMSNYDFSEEKKSSEKTDGEHKDQLPMVRICGACLAQNSMF